MSLKIFVVYSKEQKNTHLSIGSGRLLMHRSSLVPMKETCLPSCQLES